MMQVRVPPIKSQGIKTKLVPWIVKAMVWERQGCWIEPFMGTGVVGFNIAPPKALFADTNPHLIRFYQALQNHEITATTVRTFLEQEGENLRTIGGDYYYTVRERFNAGHSPLDFLFLNRSCFNGMIRFNRHGVFNVPWGHKPCRFAQAYITKIVNQVAWVQQLIDQLDWRFRVMEFQDCIDLATTDDFIYCDPPYIDRHADYYNGWDDRSEQSLYQALSTTEARFLLSTWHSNQFRQNHYISQLWSAFQVMTQEHFYHVGAAEQNRHVMKEALIANYPVTHSDEPLLR